MDNGQGDEQPCRGGRLGDASELPVARQRCTPAPLREGGRLCRFMGGFRE